MSPLDTLIRREIEASGPMPLSHYMHLCLAHPKYGYYTRQDPLGVQGDFTTAPEISQLFGEMIAIWLASTWQQMECPSSVSLVELGPGRGTLMADILRATRHVPGFHEALDIHLIETSLILRAKQVEALRPSGFDPTFHDSLEALPQVPCLFVANEFLDALPANQWVRTDKGWNARKIGLDEKDQLVFGVDLTPLPAPKQVSDQLPRGTIIEHSPAQDRMIVQITEMLKQLGGCALFLDYGSNISGHGDTLQAVENHQPASPLTKAGEVDLTTHVDFAHLTKLADETGIKTIATTEQGAFLLELGLLERAGALGAKADMATRDAISLAVERLAGDAGMGKLFKVMGLCSQRLCLPGFAKTPASSSNTND